VEAALCTLLWVVCLGSCPVRSSCVYRQGGQPRLLLNAVLLIAHETVRIVFSKNLLLTSALQKSHTHPNDDRIVVRDSRPPKSAI
jgi:hypothetical protein